MTRQELETALDAGGLEAEMTNGRWWKLRRNGKTRTWKRDPKRFEVPVKAGLRAYARLGEADLTNPHLRIAQ